MGPTEDFGLGSVAPAGDDAVLPFEVEGLDVRGRIIQMGPELTRLLARHDYPLPVSKLLGEAIVLAVLLGSSLKFEGQFLLQTQTDGAVDMLVVDYRTPGDIRAYARFDADRVAEASSASGEPTALLGKGILAMTIDQGAHTSRYQGIVQLDGGTLEDVAHTYFAQSEQIPTLVRLGVAELMTREDGQLSHGWRAGGLLVQFLPESSTPRDFHGGDVPESLRGDDESVEELEDSWVEATSLVSTVEDHELIGPEVSAERLLFRLFHERGVRVYEPNKVRDQCSCSRERIEGVLRSFSAEEITESIEDGEIRVTCEFCGQSYRFEPSEFLD